MIARAAVSALVAIALASLVVTPVSSAGRTEHAGAASLGAPAASWLTVSRFGKGFNETRPAKIVIARADGSGSRVLTTGWHSYVSPDGSQVAVVDWDTGFTNLRLELYRSAGGAAQRVVPLGCVSLYWSPDSTKIACTEYREATKTSRLIVVDVGTGAKTTLMSGNFDGQVSFSPDSTSLAFVQTATDNPLQRKSTLNVVDLATRTVKTIRSGGVVSPAWGPTEIAFATLKPRGRYFTLDVAAVRPDGSGFRVLTHFRPTADLHGPVPVAWSADGKRLLAGILGRDAWTARESYAVDPIRGGLRLIAHMVSPSVLTLDGRYVIGQTGDAESTGLAGSNVVRVPWAGGKQRILLRQAVDPSFNG